MKIFTIFLFDIVEQDVWYVPALTFIIFDLIEVVFDFIGNKNFRAMRQSFDNIGPITDLLVL
jgi:hypothetical protein